MKRGREEKREKRISPLTLVQIDHPPTKLDPEQEEELKALLKPKIMHNQEQHQQHQHQHESSSSSSKGKEKEEVVKEVEDEVATKSDVDDQSSSPLIENN